ncbi:MAG: hypothetical protein EOP61_29790 [Sphingomonadales bacterium]|nr:MAG: hypothetical protein EOP61_29790 [Sphingomonadales bacterium]
MIERAFDLARSGLYKDVPDIARQLNAEGYDGVTSRLAGPSLRKQLRELCRAPRTEALPVAPESGGGNPEQP